MWFLLVSRAGGARVLPEPLDRPLGPPYECGMATDPEWGGATYGNDEP